MSGQWPPRAVMLRPSRNPAVANPVAARPITRARPGSGKRAGSSAGLGGWNVVCRVGTGRAEAGGQGREEGGWFADVGCLLEGEGGGDQCRLAPSAAEE